MRATFFEKKSFYRPCSNFVATLLLQTKIIHNQHYRLLQQWLKSFFSNYLDKTKHLYYFCNVHRTVILWADILVKRCYWNYLRFPNSRKIWKAVKMIAVAPHHWYVRPLLAFHISFGVGYCFIHSLGNARSLENRIKQ